LPDISKKWGENREFTLIDSSRSTENVLKDGIVPIAKLILDPKYFVSCRLKTLDQFINLSQD
jgi:hypothetical protein